MGRTARRWLVGEGTVHHCTWQAHNHSRIFELAGAPELYLSLLAKYKGKYGILIHSFCIMTTHVHVQLKATRGQAAFSGFWRDVNSVFARWYNEQTERCGQVVMERLYSGQVETGGEAPLLVSGYGDRNPVMAGMVRCAKDYAYSSHRHYAYGERHPLIDDLPEYLALGKTDATRRKKYQALCADMEGKAKRRREAQAEERREDLVRATYIGTDAWAKRRRAALKRKNPPS
ncbi:MAG: transposase [Anaeromyxobacter sp.]